MSKRLSKQPIELIKRNRYIIQKLASVSDAERKNILSTAPSELYKVINLIFKILNDSNTKIPKKNIMTELNYIKGLLKTMST